MTASATATLRVESLAGGGRGVAHHGGETWLVAGALPGETVEAEVERRRRGVVEATCRRVVGAGHPARLRYGCPLAPSCGGCDWSHVAAEAGELKREVAAGAARGAPAIAERLLQAPVTTSPGSYRLRARLHWDPASRHLGFYAPRTHRVEKIGGCRVISPRLEAALEPLSASLADTGAGRVDLEWLEDLDGRCAMAAVRPAGGRHFVPRAWLPGEERLAGVVEGLQLLSPGGRVTAGWGEARITMALPIPLEVPVGAFFQGNRHLVRWLFDRIGEACGIDPLPAWDLFAGVGFMAAGAAARADRALCLVEPYRPAARAACHNLPTARIAVGRTAEAFLARHRQLPRRSLVLVDPPRAGMSAELRHRLAGWRPERIVGLSCDPATWARDTDQLLRRGFELLHVELVDLFPHTHHVELLSILEPR